MATADVIKGFPEVIQDLLAPEFKARQAEISHMREDINANTDEIKALRQDFGQMTENLTRLEGKLDAAVGQFKISERVARLEEQMQHVSHGQAQGAF